MALPPGKSHAPQRPAFHPGASTLLCPQLGRKNRSLSATVSTLGWQSPSLGYPICRAALSPHLTPSCVSHCTPGQHLKPRACCQYGAESRGLRAGPEGNAPRSPGKPCWVFFFMYTLGTNRIFCSLTRTQSSSHGAA